MASNYLVMNRFSLVFLIFLIAKPVFGQKNASVLQQNRIDSLLNRGENLFTADQQITFKYESNIDSPAEIIKEGDLIIVLKKEGNIFYEVEWDNKIGYIFQLDVSPYNILSEEHYLDKNPLNDIDRSVRYDSIEDSEEEVTDVISQQINEPQEINERENTSQGCWIQFFASRYSNKKFNQLNDLGTVTATTDLRDKLTRYRLSISTQDLTCEEVILELEKRGFPGSFNIYEE